MYFDRSDVVGTGIDEQISFSLEPVSLTVKPTITRQLCSIHFSLQKTANTTVTIYNSAGLRQKDVFRGILQKGPHSLTVAASDLTAGVYFLTLRTPAGRETVKFIVAR